MRIPTTIHAADPSDAQAEPGLYLVVMSQSSLPMHYRLPEQGDVLLGRDAQADVWLEDQRASRRHALLELRGMVISVKDLESANGTWFRNQRLVAGQPVSITLGEAITIGTTTLVIRRNQPAPLPIRACSHEHFELHLRQICQQAQTVQAQFAVARLELERPGEAAPSIREVEESGSQALLPSDMLASYSDDEYELLLLPASVKDAQTRVEALRGALGARGLRVRAAIAHFPHHGRTADELVARAHQILHGVPGDNVTSVIIVDPIMQRLYALAERAAPSDACVLILGETGVGKNVLAQRIHTSSPRSSRPFVVVNCGAIPENLVESELFGHRKGAFTGAVETHKGLIEAAHGGTLFLDEIGDLPLEIQVKLNQVLQTKVIRSLGGKETKVDVRFIAATHHDLQAEVRDGRFREDLYYRINVACLVVPPLRERPSEVVALADAFLNKICSARGVAPPALTEDAKRALHAHHWPGNVRELENAMQRAVVWADGTRITLDDLPETVTRAGGTLRPPPAPVAQDEIHARILEALQSCRYNQTKAAARLKMHRLKLRRLMLKYGLLSEDDQ